MAGKPWESESNELSFEAHGLKCYLRRHPNYWHWCGYVGVPEGHPLYENGEEDLDVHGGITYAAFGKPHGEADGLWWFGFDCAHSGDLCPKMMWHEYDVYRTIEWVEAEARKLAKQLMEIGTKPKLENKEPS